MDAVEPQQAFAERLGEWMDFSDAIALHSAHQVGAAGQSAVPSGSPSVASAAKADIEADFARLRTRLVNSINRSCLPDAGETRIKLPTPKAGATLETAADFEPYYRFYVAHQRDMEGGVRPLRGKVQQVLASGSPALRQLAALDAALDEILGVRERQLLATLPALLERRFGQLLKSHQAALPASGPADEASQWVQPDGWLTGFGKELQGALLAELDVRLQPIVGLIEAFSNEADKQQ